MSCSDMLKERSYRRTSVEDCSTILRNSRVGRANPNRAMKTAASRNDRHPGEPAVPWGTSRGYLGSDSSETMTGVNPSAESLVRLPAGGTDTHVGTHLRHGGKTSKSCLVKIHPAVLGEGLIDLPDQ